MAESSYEAALRSVETLHPADQLRLVGELTERLSLRRASGACRSILELRGMGKEVWSGVDPDQYVDRERSSWKNGESALTARRLGWTAPR